MPEAPDPLKPVRPTVVPPLKAKAPARTRRDASRSGMNKTGARILGGFSAAFIQWVWNGWLEPITGVAMDGAFLTSLGGAMVVTVEWLLVKDARQ